MPWSELNTQVIGTRLWRDLAGVKSLPFDKETPNGKKVQNLYHFLPLSCISEYLPSIEQLQLPSREFEAAKAIESRLTCFIRSRNKCLESQCVFCSVLPNFPGRWLKCRLIAERSHKRPDLACGNRKLMEK